ncbi:MAG TPA: cupin domain-containing protein [Acidimicrobiia bacterium]
MHAAQEDSFDVLEGVLALQLGDDLVELGPGDFGTAPPGVPHSFTNAHAEQPACRMLNLLTPASGFDRSLNQIEHVAAAGDRAGLERLDAQFGVRVVGSSLAERLALA